ncbi:MAG TPA: long-chain-fatty-acid--CoA ligase [Amycolatopsis sp.]|nr:long-chain-fatty-acid--CoA ligase [Amycolatopsis sp.]
MELERGAGHQADAASISSVAELVRVHGARRRDCPALTADGRTITFGQLDARSNQVAQVLAADGLGAGDRVAFLDTNSAEFFEVLFATAKLRAVTVPLNWRLAPAELAAIVNDSEAATLIVGAAFVPVLEAIEPRLPRVKTIVVIGGHERHHGYEDWTAGAPVIDPGLRATPDDVVLQLYTSGTTGEPKGVLLTERNVISLARVSGPLLGLDEDSVNLVPMPLFHIGGSGYALIGVYAGCHTVLLRQIEPRELLEVLARHRISALFAVPAVLQSLIDVTGRDRLDLSALRTITYGASPITVEALTRSIEAFRCDFVQVYGLTETTGTITVLSPEDHRRALAGAHAERLRSAGRPVEGGRVRIVSPETGADVPADAVGEVWISSPQNTIGYWRKPAETAAALTGDGWLRTGDAGHLDAEGYLFIDDRVTDMIITGGENVYPAQVENTLISHPAVAEVAVIGVPDQRWGETVKAIVVPAPSSTPTAAGLIAFARERLAHYKCPTSVDFAEALPRGPSGKLLKRELRAAYRRK